MFGWSWYHRIALKIKHLDRGIGGFIRYYKGGRWPTFVFKGCFVGGCILNGNKVWFHDSWHFS